ncbi:MAG: gamma-glutamyl-gamma-aminobutyrate hydrolase family protein [Deltaproteobacteria bacterium]|jgi:putative glutamine amidotransferase|nr:gamma-glutamyl-gamma-aminobutyrate hydrolase family protein [Deltaproteobacteria bacterium]
MTRTRPRVGITTTLEEARGQHEIWRAYPDAVERAGGLPVFLPADDAYPHYEEYLSLIDGLLLSGGQDILPSLYRQEPWGGLTETWPMSPKRDRFEIQLTKLALERGVPILGLCRGLQLLVVALGGTLWQDVSLSGATKTKQIRHFQNLAAQWPSHQVTLNPGRLRAILGESSLLVNSLHHQSADRLPPTLMVSALAADGVVEAVELQGESFALAVQWHPEHLVKTDPRQLALFTALVEAAAQGRRP